MTTPTTTGSNPAADKITSTAWSPSERPSFTPDTTTAWGVSQFDGVNVNNDDDTTTSDRSDETTDTTTSPTGSDPRANVNESEEPDSDITVEPSDSTNNPNPTTQAGNSSSTSSSGSSSDSSSFSRLTALTGVSLRAVKALSLWLSTTETTTRKTWSPSSRPSFTPVTTTVWGVSQFDGVNVNMNGETRPSSWSWETTEKTTFEEGSASRTTVNESVSPSSVTTVEPPDSTTV